MENFLIILGGGLGIALVEGVVKIVQWKMARKAQIEDKADDAKADEEDDRKKELDEINEKMDVLREALQISLFDRIKYIAKAHIERCWISVEDLEDLERMHKVYHNKEKLNGNGFLDGLMAKVRELPNHPPE